MYYPNYNPFYMHNRNYYNRSFVQPNVNIQEIKKDTAPSNDDTISFKDFCPNNTSESATKIEDLNSKVKSNNRFFSFDKDKISILGFDLEIDDLIILALIILLLRDYHENYPLIIILGLILLNINLSDILNLF